MKRLFQILTWIKDEKLYTVKETKLSQQLLENIDGLFIHINEYSIKFY